MLARLVELSLRRGAIILLLTAILVVIGMWSAVRLPIDAVPDITNVQVQVNTAVPALAPEEIEQMVTFPLESELAGIQGMIEMRSLSKFGLSQVNLVFADGTDVFRARQLVTERLQQTELPPGLTPRLAPIATGLGEIFYYTVDFSADATNKPASRVEQLMQLKQINDWTIEPSLRTVPGIAELNSTGGYERQFVVYPNLERLAETGLSFSRLAEIIAENVKNEGGGIIAIGGEQVVIRTTGRVQSVDEIANIPLKFRATSVLIRVKDVADVAIGSGVRTGAATANGEEAVLGSAIMLMGENSRVVAKRVAEKLQEIQEKLPQGVQIRTMYDRTSLVNRTIHTVEKNLFEGAVLVVAILFGMLGNWRAAIIVALAIPLSMLFALTGMFETRISGNLMSLGAIDFGLIIDGSVVMVENIVRHVAELQKKLGRALTFRERRDAVAEAAKQVVNPMFFGVLIITLVYAPIFVLTGIEGKMFKPMAATVIFALAGSLVLALTLMPLLCAWFLKGKIKEEDNWLISAFKRVYRPILNFALAFRSVIVALAILLIAAAAFIYTRLGAEFIPQLDEGSFAIQMIRTTSISLDASLDLQKKAERELLKRFPEITYAFSRIGTSEIATDPMGANVSDTYAFFNPIEKWRKVDGRTITKDELADLINKELSVIVPGQSYLFTQPIEMRFNEILEGTRADVAIKIFGDDYSELERLAKSAAEIIERIPGAADVEFDAIGKAPMLEISPKREAMANFNVHLDELNRVVATALAGTDVGTVNEGNQRFKIVVRMRDEERERLETIKRLPITTDDGGVLPLHKLANIQFVERVSMIQREAGQRRAAILINLRGRDVESFVNEAKVKLTNELKLPAGYFVEFGGQFKNLQQAKTRLMVVVPGALLLIFALIYLSFQSVRQAALIFLCVPLAMTGGVFALAVRDLPFSISAAVGFIALSGIAVLNGIMLISYINQLRAEGTPLGDSVREGSLTRLRPKLMTALVASLGFVPMAIATGAGAEVQRPLATVVIGGIISSTFLTLVLLPTLYEWMEARTEKRPSKGELAI
jgi:heavy metal efflux system protein